MSNVAEASFKAPSDKQLELLTNLTRWKGVKLDLDEWFGKAACQVSEKIDELMALPSLKNGQGEHPKAKNHPAKQDYIRGQEFIAARYGSILKIQEAQYGRAGKAWPPQTNGGTEAGYADLRAMYSYADGGEKVIKADCEPREA